MKRAELLRALPVLLALLLFLSATHLYAIREAPGIHFDEALAANLSARMALEGRLWAQWHGDVSWSSLWMRVFGVSLESFRVSRLILSMAGVGLGAWALWLRGARVAAACFPLVVAFTPALVVNHRFAVAAHSALPLSIGLLAAAQALGRKHTRPAVFLALLSLASALSCLAPFCGLALGQVAARLSRRWHRTGLALFAPFFAVFLFFWDGHWSMLSTFGRLEVPLLIGVQGVLALVLALRCWKLMSGSSLWADCAAWFSGSVVLLSFLPGGPSASAFEGAFLLFAALIALGLERLVASGHFGKAQLWLICFVAVGAFDLQMNYWRPALLGEEVDADFKFLSLRASSSEFLPKQRVAQFLADNGCRFERLRFTDARLEESFRFLSLGDWNPSSPNLEARICQWPSLRIERELSDQARVSKLDWIIARISGLLVLR